MDKTLTAVNLIIAISQEVKQTVVLIGLDLRGTNTHTIIGINIQKGIVDHLRNGESWKNILIGPGCPCLIVFPELRKGKNTTELLSSPEMTPCCSDVGNRYPQSHSYFRSVAAPEIR